jgi:acyl CoA:acetate/3-ketoacid CoA transferase alpha subunit
MPTKTILGSDMLKYEWLPHEVREKGLRVTKKKYEIITCLFIGNKILLLLAFNSDFAIIHDIGFCVL